MAMEFKGCLVSLDCGNEGIYQGIVLNVDPIEKTITIEKPFKEGYALDEDNLTIKASQMLDLKVLKMPIDASIVNVKKAKKLSIDSKPPPLNQQQQQQQKSALSNKQGQASNELNGLQNSISEMFVSNTINSSSSSNKAGQFSNNNKKVNNKNNRSKNNSISNNNNNNKSPSFNISSSSSLLKPHQQQQQQRSKAFGEFRHFQERQIPAPMRLKINNKRGNVAQGSSGTSLMDCSMTGGNVFVNSNKKPQNNNNITPNLIKLAMEFKGCLVSLDCGDDEGIYQGIVLNVDPIEKTITIEKPFKEGYPLDEANLTIKGSQMFDLKVLKMPPEPSIVNVKKAKKLSIDSKPPPLNQQQQQQQKSALSNKQGQASNELNGLQNSISEMFVSNTINSSSSSNKAGQFSNNNKKVNNKNNRSKNNSISNNNNNKSPSFNISSSSSLLKPHQQQQQQRSKAFGEFRHFQERQIPAPMRLKINNKRGNVAQGPSGIPLIDCSNGYTSIGNDGDLGNPLDFALLSTDFDFDSNLALFDKTKFFADSADNNNSSSVVGGGGGGGISSGDVPVQVIKRNFRNDENVLTDPSRILSWTTQKNVVVEAPISTVANAINAVSVNEENEEEKEQTSSPLLFQLDNDSPIDGVGGSGAGVAVEENEESKTTCDKTIL